LGPRTAAEGVTAFILAKSPLAVTLLTLHLELVTQRHYVDAFKGNGVSGDSGSGHSFGDKAFGSHTGACIVSGLFGDMFSVADYFSAALASTSSVLF
jgi:hypothetical protein